MRLVGYNMLEATFLKTQILKVLTSAEQNNKPEAVDDSILPIRTNFEEIQMIELNTEDFNV